MRHYQTFNEAFNEIKRDLGEMGTNVHTQTYQNKHIADDRNFATKELQYYSYMVINPRFIDLSPIQPWADMEWEERLSGIHGEPVNPGTAWLARKDIWGEFINEDGEFDYTYSERFARFNQVMNVVDLFNKDPQTRQAVVSMWTPEDSIEHDPIRRKPCTQRYQFMFRDDVLYCKYEMRSCDWSTHFQNDIFLAMKLQHFIADSCALHPGPFIHSMDSLHVYNRDVADVF